MPTFEANHAAHLQYTPSSVDSATQTSHLSSFTGKVVHITYMPHARTQDMKKRSSPSQAAALDIGQFAAGCLLSNCHCCAALPAAPLAPLLTLQQR